MTALHFALAALAPAMIGPLPNAQGDALVVALCGGGTISIPLGDKDPAPAPPCNFKACHGGDNCRKKFDRSQ